MKIKKNENEITENLYEQVYLLNKACENYDNGDKLEIINIGIRLRVMLHETQNSTSLFTHLGINDIMMYNVATTNNPNNLFPETNLVSVVFNEHMRYKHKTEFSNPRKLNFKEWWDSKIILSEGEKKFTRKNLILNLVHSDGGAHVDSRIDSDYKSFKDNEATNLIGFVGNNNVLEDKDLIYTSIRAIAHEVLLTLKDHYPLLNISTIEIKTQNNEPTLLNFSVEVRKK